MNTKSFNPEDYITGNKDYTVYNFTRSSHKESDSKIRSLIKRLFRVIARRPR